MGSTSVLIMNGAPRIAPSPTCTRSSPVPKKIAMIGMEVSGSVVPTAARMLPTAPSGTFRRFPSHSIPFVKR